MTGTGQFDVVLVGYRPADTRSALRFCNRHYPPARGGRRLLVLNRHGLLDDHAPERAGWTILNGSNRLAEFSGWQEGLDALATGSRSKHGVVFVNDTVCAHRHFTGMRARAFTQAARDCGPSSIVGFRDSVWQQFSIAEIQFDAWTSTYCFMLTAAALGSLNDNVCDLKVIASCVPGGLNEDGFFARLSPDLDAHLQRWLFGGGWYGSDRLTSDSGPRLLLKGRCIAAELLLSARCFALGIEACDPFDRHPRLERMDRALRRLRRECQAFLGR